MTTVTPKNRTLRSNSNPSNPSITLSDIHTLINNTKNEILTSFKSELDKLNSTLSVLTKKVNILKEKITDISQKQKT